MTVFELEALGGPWAKRLRRRRREFASYPWKDAGAGASPDALLTARVVWTRSAHSEYASAACFAEIAATLLAAGAPLDLAAAAGDFVVDELLHTELSARMAAALGGAVALDVELDRLVRPPIAASPLLRAAEFIVRTCCVGESLTVPVLKAGRAAAASASLTALVLGRLARDESHHAELGWWFLDWAAERLSDDDRRDLGRAAQGAIAAFEPLFSTGCSAPASDLGVMSCGGFDHLVRSALETRVRKPLAARGISTLAGNVP